MDSEGKAHGWNGRVKRFRKIMLKILSMSENDKKEAEKNDKNSKNSTLQPNGKKKMIILYRYNTIFFRFFI